MYTTRPLSVFKNSAGAAAIQPPLPLPPPPPPGGLVRERRRAPSARARGTRARRSWEAPDLDRRTRRSPGKTAGGRKAERAKPRVWASLWAPMPDSPSPEKNMAPGTFRTAWAKSNMRY
ncbi:unnamed protein product [Musa acuminata subsp. burmannicoides]